MKRRNFLKAIGIGAVIAPAVVKAEQAEPIEWDAGLLEPRERQSMVDYNGWPFLAGCAVTICACGSDNMLLLYSDKALTKPRNNPVMSDSNGIFPNFYMKEEYYKAIYREAAGPLIMTHDGITI